MLDRVGCCTTGDVYAAIDALTPSTSDIIMAVAFKHLAEDIDDGCTSRRICFRINVIRNYMTYLIREAGHDSPQCVPSLVERKMYVGTGTLIMRMPACCNDDEGWGFVMITTVYRISYRIF